MGVLTSARILTFGGQYKSGSGRLSGGQHPRGQLGGVNAMPPPVVGASNKNYGETKQIVKLYQIQFEGLFGHRTLIFCTVGVKVHNLGNNAICTNSAFVLWHTFELCTVHANCS